jgi:hypothetical protein
MRLNDNPYKPMASYFSPEFLDKKFGELKNMQASAMMHGLCMAYPQTLAIVHIAPHAL